MAKTKLMLVHDSSAPPLTPEQLADHGGEPRIRDLVLAERLKFSDRHMIRRLVDRNEGELRSYGEISVAVTENADPKGRGRPGKEYWLNEGQALVICALSRTPQAAAVRKQVITVFMAYRAGKLAPTAPALPEPGAATDRLAAMVETLDAFRAELTEMRKAAAKAQRPPAPKPTERAIPPSSPTPGGSLLYGMQAIADHLGITPRQAKHLAATGRIPVFKLGGRAIAATRTMLDARLARASGEVRS